MRLSRMGYYIKGPDALILKPQIHAVSFSRDQFALKDCASWLLENELYPYQFQTREKDFLFQIRETPSIAASMKKESFKMADGVKAVCYRGADLVRVVAEKKDFPDFATLESFLKDSGVSLENKTETEKTVTYVLADESQYKSDSEMRKVISKGLTYIYYERRIPDFGEENLMKRKGLLEKPKSFQFHMPIEVAEKSEKSAPEDFIIEGFASTGAVDRDGDIVSPESFGKALDGYMDNPILCYMHDWTDPIGTITYARIVSAGQELSVGKRRMQAPTGGLFVRASVSASAPKIRQLISEGVLKAFSIGFMINDARYDEVTDVRVITDIELYEISVVSIPSNRQSLFSLSKALEVGTDVMCADCVAHPEKEAECCGAHKEADGNKDSEAFRARLVTAVKEKALVLKGLSPSECVEKVCKFGDIDLTKKEWFNEPEKKEEEKAPEKEEAKAEEAAAPAPEPAVETKETRKEFLGVTASVENIGEDESQNHQHDLRVFVEVDDLGQIVSIEGIAEQGTNTHSHPVREVGKTEAVDGHYHTFTKLDPVGGEGSSLRVSAPAQAKSKTYKVPREIMEVLVEVAVQKCDDAPKLLSAVQYLEDLVTRGTEYANKMFYVRQLEALADKVAQDKVLLRQRLDKVLAELVSEGLFGK